MASAIQIERLTHRALRRVVTTFVAALQSLTRRNFIPWLAYSPISDINQTVATATRAARLACVVLCATALSQTRWVDVS